MPNDEVNQPHGFALDVLRAKRDELKAQWQHGYEQLSTEDSTEELVLIEASDTMVKSAMDATQTIINSIEQTIKFLERESNA